MTKKHSISQHEVIDESFIALKVYIFIFIYKKMSINYSKRSVDKSPLNIKYLAVPHYSENCHVVLSKRKNKRWGG